MGKVEEAVRSVVLQVVAREVKEALGPMAKDLVALKRSLANLEKAISSIKRTGAKTASVGRVEPVALEVSQDEIRRSRITPDMIKRLRAKLGITQIQLAALLGVTGPAIAQWEGGTSEPRGTNRAKLVGLRKLNRKKVTQLLEERGIERREKI